MKNAWNDMLYNFDVFIGPTRGHLILYMLSILAVMFIWKKYRYKILAPMVLLTVIVFNPLVYKALGERFLSGVYWRLFWVFPAAVTIALVAAEVICSVRAKWMRIVIGGVIAVIIIVTGKPVISRANFDFAKNDYQLNQATVEVCDIILSDKNGSMTKAIVPYEMLTEVRQYTSRIGLMYGRNVDGYIGDIDGHDLWAYDIMSSAEPDFESLRTIAIYKNVEYIVFNSEINNLLEDMEAYGYDYIADVDQYVIYKVCAQ